MSTSADVDLLPLVRDGDQRALATLYDLHREPALRFARGLVADPHLAEDLVADAFERVLSQVRDGRGPRTNFRAYLLTAVRNRYVDEVRRGARVTPVSDQPWVLDAEEVADPVDELFDEDEAVAAFSRLPDSWRQVLWHVEVEGRPLADAANLLGLTPTAASSLAHRAREGLKLAYLDHRIASRSVDRSCRWTVDRLSQYVRGGLSPRAAAKVQDHVTTCASCTGALADLEHTNRRLAALLLPVVVVGATAARGGGSADGPSSSSGSSSAAGRSAGRTGPRTGTRSLRAARTARAAGRGGRAGWAAPTALAGAAAAGVVALATVAALAWWPAGSDPAAAPGRPSAPSSPDEPAATPGSTEVPEVPVATDPATDPEETPPASAAPDAPVTDAPVTDAPLAAAAPALREPATTRVRPVAPQAVPVARCGSWGRLVLPTTTGVRYRLSEGDGRSGPWRVVASARSGYVLARGATSSFGGDLGSHRPCPEIASVSRTSTSATAFDTTADLTATDAGSYVVGLELRFDVTVYTQGFSGAGWQCWATDGGSRMPLDGSEYQIEPGIQWIVCEFAYQGTDPGPVTAGVDTLVASTVTGTATATRDGTAVASTGF